MIVLLVALAACSSKGTQSEHTQTFETATPGATLTFTSGVPPKNLLMISIDTLRRDELARYGTDGMPFLSGLADAGFAMDNVRSCSNWTMPSTGCMVGGRSSIALAEETGVMPQTGEMRDLPMGEYPLGTPFLASWLRPAGFFSALATANGVFSPSHGNGQGYDEVFVRHNADADSVFLEGRALLSPFLAASDDRWFLHLHLMEPHKPYDPPESYLAGVEALEPVPYDLSEDLDHKRAIFDIWEGALTPEMEALVIEHFVARYHAETRWLDDRIASFWAQMQSDGLLDDTLVVVWTDHGEQFYEHGMQTHANHLYKEENDAALFFWSETLVQGSTEVPVSSIDLVPTLLDLYGLERPAEVTGLSLSEIPEDRARYAFAVSKAGPMQSVELGKHKLHWAFADPDETDEEVAQAFVGLSFFDLEADPLEQDPSFSATDPKLLELWELAKPQVQRAEPYVRDLGFEVLWPPDLP